MLKPLNDRVLVRRTEPKKTTESGLVIPDQAQKTQEFIVMAVGRGLVLPSGAVREPEVKRGDRVLIVSQYAVSEFEHDGEKLLAVHESDIACVLE